MCAITHDNNEFYLSLFSNFVALRTLSPFIVSIIIFFLIIVKYILFLTCSAVYRNNSVSIQSIPYGDI